MRKFHIIHFIALKSRNITCGEFGCLDIIECQLRIVSFIVCRYNISSCPFCRSTKSARKWKAKVSRFLPYIRTEAPFRHLYTLQGGYRWE